MRRLGRWLLNSVTVLLVLACAATIVFWVRSYWQVDSVVFFLADRHGVRTQKDGSAGAFDAGRVYEADSRRGSLRLLYLYEDNSTYFRRLNPALWFSADEDALQPWAAAADHWPGVAIEIRPVRQALPNGPGFASGGPPPPPPPVAYTVRALYTPWALWTLLTALLPAWSLRRRMIRRSARRADRCPHCSYDLTGNISGVCPECGKSVARRSGGLVNDYIE